jgi:mono/diheme cytochrome c family protein
MVFALSTTHEIGLACTGGAFIVFALVSSFVLPRWNSNFPGSGRNWYLLLTVAFFVAMISAVIVFGREKKEASGATGTTTTQTAPAGNAAAGKTQFTSSGCVACHTFKPAASTGKVGPDLDTLAADAAKAKLPVAQFATEAITNPPAPYVPPGYPKNAMPKLPLSSAQVANLVAFLTSSS